MPLNEAQQAALVAEIRDDPDGLGYAGKSAEAIRALLICPDRPKPTDPVESTRAVSRIAALEAVPGIVAAEVALREAATSDARAATVLDVWTRYDTDWSSDLGTSLLGMWSALGAQDAAALVALCRVTTQAPTEYHPQRRTAILGRGAKLSIEDVQAALAEIGA